jgi:uncharacterized protein
MAPARAWTMTSCPRWQKNSPSKVATLRYQFPYMENGHKRPDPPRVAHAAVRAAVAEAARQLPGVPLYAGGKSFGARMTSQAHAATKLPDVRGLIFFGWPLHPAGQPGTERAQHLPQIDAPMLFFQGTRDKLADLPLIESVCRDLGPRATLHLIPHADHAFHVPAKSGRRDPDVLRELAEVSAAWIHLGASRPFKLED